MDTLYYKILQDERLPGSNKFGEYYIDSVLLLCARFTMHRSILKALTRPAAGKSVFI